MLISNAKESKICIFTVEFKPFRTKVVVSGCKLWLTFPSN